jgi:hypothetical protein
MSNFAKFRIGDLFEIHPTKSYGLTNYNLFATIGKTPVVVNSSLNNGIGGYVDLAPTEHGNMITFSDTTTSDAIFYQPDDFIGYSHIQGLYTKTKWSKKSLLYFVVAFRKVTNGRFNYAAKLNRKIVADLLVELPILANGDINFKEMEHRIRELEAARIRELEAYLAVTGLSNYTITEADRAILAKFNSSNTPPQKKFRLGDLFRISTGAILPNSILRIGKIPRISVKSSDNGIIGFYDTDNLPDSRNYENFISVNFFGKAFYHPYKASVEMKVHVLQIPNVKLTREIALYLISLIDKLFANNFSYGGQLSSSKLRENDYFIDLPTRENGEPDFDFMEKFIRVQEKLAVAKLANFREREIAATKSVVAN